MHLEVERTIIEENKHYKISNSYPFITKWQEQITKLKFGNSGTLMEWEFKNSHLWLLITWSKAIILEFI